MLCAQDAQASTQSGTRHYDSNQAQPCLDALNAAYGGSHSVIPYAQLEGPASIADKCERVFAGAAQQDHSCQTDYDCAGELACSPVTPGATSRVCAPVQHVAAGAFCANPGELCPPDQYCAPLSGGVPECQPAATQAATCSDAVPCISSQRCVAGSCAARAQSGGQCATSADCDSQAPYCDPNASVCAIGLTFALGSTDCQAYVPGTAIAMPTVGGSDGGADGSAPTVGDAAAD